MFNSKQLLTSKNAGPVLSFRTFLGFLFVAFGLFAISTGNAFASMTITGTVGISGKYLVTGAPVTTTAVTVLKLSFENKTPGTNLELCAGTAADFAAGTRSARLSDSGGPGFVFLTITETAQMQLLPKNMVKTAEARRRFKPLATGPVERRSLRSLLLFPLGLRPVV